MREDLKQELAQCRTARERKRIIRDLNEARGIHRKKHDFRSSFPWSRNSYCINCGHEWSWNRRDMLCKG